jgi:iron complex outermembrane receptor protein
VLGVTLHASDTLNLYANYGKGFETPTLAEVAYTGSGGATPAARFNRGLGASRRQHYELGLKWLPGPLSRMDLNFFQIDSTDEIVVSTSAIVRTAFKNAPGTRRRGIELSATTQLIPHFSALLSSSLINAEFSQPYANSSASVAAGNKLPGIPRSNVFSELLWSSRPLDSGAKSRTFVGSRAGLELTSAGKMYANDVNTASAEGFTTLNARFSHGWALGSANLTAYGRIDNLTDQRYVGSVIANQAASQFYEPAPGRDWTLGLRLTVPI